MDVKQPFNQPTCEIVYCSSESDVVVIRRRKKKKKKVSLASVESTQCICLGAFVKNVIVLSTVVR